MSYMENPVSAAVFSEFKEAQKAAAARQKIVRQRHDKKSYGFGITKISSPLREEEKRITEPIVSA